MFKHMLGILLVMLCVTQALAQAAPPSPPAASLPATQPAYFLAPFIDSQTLAVAHLDAAKIDTAALEKYAVELMDGAKVPADDELRKQVAAARGMADVFLARFKQLGGRHVYALLSHPDIWPHQQPLALLFKIEPGGDAATLKELLTSTFGMARITPGEPGPQELANGTLEAVMLREDLLFIGQDAAFQRLRTLKPEPRPELTLATTAPLEVVAALTADERRALAELMPAFPQEIGGGSTEFLTRAAWIARLQLALPPNPSLTLRLEFPVIPLNQARNTYSGTTTVTPAVLISPTHDLDAFILRLRDLLLASPDFAAAMNSPEFKPQAAELTVAIKEVLTPANGTLTLTDKHIQMFAHLLLPELNKAKERAQQAVSATRLKGILTACFVYASANNDLLPETLNQLVKTNAIPPEFLVNPADAKHRPYSYRRWVPLASKYSSPSTTPIVWEEVDDAAAPRYAGFADGHVELVANRAALDALLKQAQDAADRAAKPPTAGLP